MGGFYGVAARRSCVDEVFYGTDYNSHLGTRRAGMAFIDADGCFTRQIHSLENNYFRTKFEDDLKDFHGNTGIGVISDTDAQPIIINCHLGKFALVTVAKINNTNEIEQRLLKRGIHFCEHGTAALNPTELVGALISEGATYVDGIENVYRNVKGSCSMLLLTPDGIIAARDALGRTPVLLARKGDAMAVSSESCAFPNLGYHYERDLGPGEVVLIKADSEEVLRKPGEHQQVCAFLWTYYGYPPCDYEGRNVDAMRYDTGLEMGRDDKTDIDFVAPIPDSGTCMALGYAAGIGKPFKRGIVKYTPTWPRSFTPGTQSRRELVAKMKLIPNPSLIKGNKVMFCDDSIVRGTQLRDNVSDLREAGAKEVHIRISCPPLIYPCRFINFTSSKSPMELIARRVIARLEGHAPADPATADWEPSAELLQRYATTGTPEYKALVEEIRKELKLDSLQFAPIETVVRSIGLPKCRICTHCFDGSSYDYNV